MEIGLKKIFIITSLFAVFLFLPFQQIHAEGLDFVDSLLTLFRFAAPAPALGVDAALQGLNSITDLNPYNIGFAIIQGLVNLFNKYAYVLLNLCYSFLQMVTSADFLGAKVTSGNTIVSEGWGIVRNLANIALVFGLIAIAISIMLGYQETQAKKTLINFILVAVLINFTPVICGLIIDAANSLMYAFLQGATSSNYLAIGGQKVSDGISSTGIDTVTILAYFIIMSVYYLCSALLIFLYVILFLTRYIILQILVIASPLAFATRVFKPVNIPFIKSIFPEIFFWDNWWQQFLKWAFVGIPAAFFLYLANLIASNVPVVTGSISDLFALLIPFFFLLCGWSACISSGGIVGGLQDVGGGAAVGSVAGFLGAQRAKAQKWVIGGAKNVAGSAANATKRMAAGATAGAITGFAGGTGIGGRLEAAGKGAYSGAITPAGREEGAQWYSRRGKEIVSGVGIGKAAGNKKLEELSADDLHLIASRNAFTETAAREKWGAHKELFKKGKLTEDEIKSITQDLRGADAFGFDLKELAKQRPDYAKNLLANDKDYKDLSSEDAIRKIIAGMSPSEAGKTIRSDAFKDPRVLVNLAPRVLEGKINKGSPKDIEGIKEGIIKMMKIKGEGGDDDINSIENITTEVHNIPELYSFLGKRPYRENVIKKIEVLQGNPLTANKAESVRELFNAVNQGKII